MISFRPDWMADALSILGSGMLGVFLITGLIIAAVKLLNRLSD